MNAEFAIDKAFDAGLETVLETVFAGGDSIINSTSSKVASSIDESIHL